MVMDPGMQQYTVGGSVCFVTGYCYCYWYVGLSYRSRDCSLNNAMIN
jgi:hypothetical protein